MVFRPATLLLFVVLAGGEELEVPVPVLELVLDEVAMVVEVEAVLLALVVDATRVSVAKSATTEVVIDTVWLERLTTPVVRWSAAPSVDTSVLLATSQSTNSEPKALQLAVAIIVVLTIVAWLLFEKLEDPVETPSITN
jgi:hypothetical protein